MRNNPIMHVLPAIHAQAILDGIKAEHSSSLLEDVMAIRVSKCLNSVEIDYSIPEVKAAYDSVLSQYKQYYYDSDVNNYMYEDQINSRLMLDYSQLFRLARSQEVSFLE
jgi:hypothetical protein